MKFAKYLLTLALALCAFASITKAQTIQFLGGGSSALFQELGDGSQHITDANGAVSCLWTYAKTTSGTPYAAFADNRSGIPVTDENGIIFVAWGPGASGGTCAVPKAPFSIYAYMSLDSVVGDRCYFIVDATGTGCVLKFQGFSGVVGSGGTGAGQILDHPNDIPSGIALPASIATALAASPRFFVAGTDIRPEDAQFVIQRAFTPCNQYLARQYFNQDSYYAFGLGYQTGTANIGTAISGSSLGSGSFNVYNFHITGTDPITGGSTNVPTYTVSTVGAQPMIIAVAPIGDGQVNAMRDITGFTLSQFLAGYLGRSDDLLGPSGGEKVDVMVREPLSGTYNTLEWSIPNGTQFHGSQDLNNCNGSGTVSSNPMVLPSDAGVTGAARYRVIGTGKMTAALQAATSGNPRLGYFFWGVGNVVGLTNVKYLTVNGIDPLLNQQSAYTYNGALPSSGATGDPGIGAVTFTMLNAGDYPIWSPLRLVGPSSGAGATGVTNMLSGLAALNTTQKDYIPVNSLNIWHSHFFINGQNDPNPAAGPTVGGGTTTLCAGGLPEAGGDAGGENMLVKNTVHFCSDFGSTQGKLNLTQ